MPENKKINKSPSTEENVASFTAYELDLGTFEEPSEGAYKNSQEGKVNIPFKWKVIEKYDNFEDAYHGYKAYISKQLTYDRKELEAIWSNGRIDVRLRHGPKMLDWCGIYTRSKIDPEEEDSKQIKGKDPIEAQEEKESGKKDSMSALSVNDSVFIKIFLEDSIREIIPDLEHYIDGQLKNNIYNSSISTKLSNIKIKLEHKREVFVARGVSKIITSSKKDKEKMNAYINKALRSIRTYAGYSISISIVDIDSEAVITGIEGSYSKFTVVFEIDGHSIRNDESTGVGEIPEAKLTGNQTRVNEIMNLKDRALAAFQNYNNSGKEELRDELGEGLRALEEGSKRAPGEEREELFDTAERAFLRVLILSESTAEGRSGAPIVASEVVGQQKKSESESEEARLARIQQEEHNKAMEFTKVPGYKNRVKAKLNK